MTRKAKRQYCAGRLAARQTALVLRFVGKQLDVRECLANARTEPKGGFFGKHATHCDFVAGRVVITHRDRSGIK